MEPVVIILVAVAALSAVLALVWLRAASKSGGQSADKAQSSGGKPKNNNSTTTGVEGLDETIAHDVDHVFNTEFREELRNRGRLYFEKIINENAMFLQQDLRLTTSQLNDYMKFEIKKVLKDEFSKYEESIKGAKDLAIASMEKTQGVIEEQRSMLEKQLTDEVAKEKERMMSLFERDMADIVNHYVLTAIGEEIDVTDQLEYIVQYLEQNKEAIIQDLKHGAA